MSNYLVTVEDFHKLFIDDVPFLDVRAEVEFEKGHFPTSYNIPILNNKEREIVGICYKNKGREAAISLGQSLVKGDLKETRIKAWYDFAQTHHNTHIYCWRGGLRSIYACQWISETGIEVPKIDGGFKALRRHLIEETENAAKQVPMIRIGGKTGTSKTTLINSVEFNTDLEGHANHRGSSFGRRVSGIKTQIDFENSLGIDLIKKRSRFPNRTLVLEDESRRIGDCVIPDKFLNAMNSSPIGIIEMPIDFRVNHIVKEYVVDMYEEFLDSYPENGWDLFVDYLTQSLARVQKRLGYERFIKIKGMMDKALEVKALDRSTNKHDGWVKELIINYYDPMYEYQLEKKKNQIVFKGTYDDVLEWALEKSKTTKL